MTAYAVGKSASDGASFVLVPFGDLNIINDMLALVDDVMIDEVEVRERVAATVTQNSNG